MLNRRDEISEALRRRLEQARDSYARAGDEYNRLMAISAELDIPGNPALLDGSYAVRQALRVYRQARLEYQQALKEFNNFILHGKLPADPGGSG